MSNTVVGYRIVKIKQQQFIINTNNDGTIMKGSKLSSIDHHTTSNDQYDHHHHHHHHHHQEEEFTNSSTYCYYNESNNNFRGNFQSLVLIIKTPQYWIFEIDEQVKQISCGDFIVLVGSSGYTLYLWKVTSDVCELVKFIFDERVDVVGFRKYLLVKTASGDLFMSENSENHHELTRLSNLPFDNRVEKIVDIACGSTHNLILTDKGNVYGYGQNYGQLGVKTTNYTDSWVISKIDQIPEKIKRVFCTYNTSFLLTEKGHLYGCGDHSYGANGLLSSVDSSLWVQIPNLEDEIVTDVKTGLFFVAVLTQSQRIYVFGYFNFRQFGISPKYVYDVNRGPKLMDSFYDMNNIRDIVCGGYNSAILTRDNAVYIGGDTNLINSNGGYTQFYWNQLVPQLDKSTSVLKIGLTSDRLVISIHQNSISKYFKFTNAWKIADVFFSFE